MVVLLSLLASSLANKCDFPMTVDVAFYERVEHALADGTPDPAAPDNAYTRMTYHYVLSSDSNSFPADSKGERVMHENGSKFEIVEGTQESAPAPQSLNDKFKAVRLIGKGTVERKVGSGEFMEQEQVVHKGQRDLIYHVQTTQEQVEIHTQGKLRVTRSWHMNNWSVAGCGMINDKEPFNAKKVNLFGLNGDKRAIASPAVYKFPK